MQLREFYRLANESQKKTETNILYDPQTGYVKYRVSEKPEGIPCASPLDFNRKTRRSLIDANKKK